MKKKEKQKVNKECVSRTDCCSACSLCRQSCLITVNAGARPRRQPQGAVAGFSVLFCGFGDSFVKGSIPWVFSCLLLCFNAFAAGKRDVFAFKIRTNRKKVLLMR